MTSMPAVLSSLIKGALNAATKSLAIECAKNRVRVNAVSPGIIKTLMHPLEAHQFLPSLHPMGRMGEVSDVVDAGKFSTSTEDKWPVTIRSGGDVWSQGGFLLKAAYYLATKRGWPHCRASVGPARSPTPSRHAG
jgi:NAD(P)-dependent dehydrogenase (short-subunit alcohol dehydrogenase family)